MSYRDILNQSFHDRSLANPSYSLRAFARDLEVPVSTLSEILNGKKGMSAKRALNFAHALRLPEWQVQMFCDLVIQEHAKSPQIRKKAKSRLESLRQENAVHLLNQSALRALTSWVDLAILELTYLDGFKISSHWISEKLGVSETRVSSSIERLKASNLLIQDKEGKAWVDASPLFSTTDGIPNESIKQFHRSVLQLAMQKIERLGVEKRTMKTVVFSVSEDHISKAKQILDEAIAKIVSIADESKQQRIDVMCFSAQIFSLLEKKESK